MVKNSLVCFLFIFCLGSTKAIKAQDTLYRFVVFLENKDNNQFSVEQPAMFMSERALLRREKQKIDFDLRGGN